MGSFFVAANAVVPFICYMSYGYLIRHLGFGDEAFYKRLNQIVFKAFFPLMMFNSLYNSKADFQTNTKLALTAVVILLTAILLSVLLTPLFVKGNPQRGVVAQATWRSNTLMFALPLAVSMYGDEAGSLASIVIACCVPIYNIAAVFILEYFRRTEGEKTSAAKMLRNILTNPLIIGAIAGLVFRGLHIPLPACILKPIKSISDMTSPLAIFICGATLVLPDIRKNIKLITICTVLKLVVLPAIVTTICYLLGFRGIELFILFSLYATPLANAIFPMSQSMGGDGELAGEMLAISTVSSMFTIFLWIIALNSVGVF